MISVERVKTLRQAGFGIRQIYKLMEEQEPAQEAPLMVKVKTETKSRKRKKNFDEGTKMEILAAYSHLPEGRGKKSDFVKEKGISFGQLGYWRKSATMKG